MPPRTINRLVLLGWGLIFPWGFLLVGGGGISWPFVSTRRPVFSRAYGYGSGLV